MGRTSRWLRGLLGSGGGGGKKDSSSSANSAGGGGGSDGKTHKKKRWSFVKSFRDNHKDHRQQRNTHLAQISSNERRGSTPIATTPTPTSTTITHSGYLDGGVDDPNKHAIAVAAATAAVAEAAIAAAHAAAAVVKLTSSGRCATAAYVSGNGAWREEEEVCAAVKIQAAFRGYLARRALHALKALVKLQALVRGYIVRKGTAETMRCMQALVRVQARARAGRAHVSETLLPSNKPSISHNPGPATPEKHELPIRTKSARQDRGSTLKRNFSKPNSRGERDLAQAHLGKSYSVHKMYERPWHCGRETKSGPTDDEKSDKILEIDPAGKPIFNTKRWNALHQSQSLDPFTTDRMSQSLTTLDSPSKDSTTAQLLSSSPSSGEVQSAKPQVSQLEINDEVLSTTENSPQFYSATSRGGSAKHGPFTPTSNRSRSYFSGYSDYPSYMSNTESSRAKVRSQSAPKQRLEFEKTSSTEGYSEHGFGEVRSSSAQRASAALHSSFTNKAYPGSGRLSRLGMPIRSETIGYSGSLRTKLLE